jgi:hypothetical protein
MFSSFDLRRSFQHEPTRPVIKLRGNFAKFAASNFTRTKDATKISEVRRWLLQFESESETGVFFATFMANERRFAWTLMRLVASLTHGKKMDNYRLLFNKKKDGTTSITVFHTAHAWEHVDVTAISIKMYWTSDDGLGIFKWQNKDIYNDVEVLRAGPVLRYHETAN